jgi:hypothetical protein
MPETLTSSNDLMSCFLRWFVANQRNTERPFTAEQEEKDLAGRLMILGKGT